MVAILLLQAASSWRKSYRRLTPADVVGGAGPWRPVRIVGIAIRIGEVIGIDGAIEISVEQIRSEKVSPSV